MFGRRDDALTWASAFDALVSAKDETIATLRARVADLERQVAEARAVAPVVPVADAPAPVDAEQAAVRWAIAAVSGGNPALRRTQEREAARLQALGWDGPRIAQELLYGEVVDDGE
jgi:phage shock protein A